MPESLLQRIHQILPCLIEKDAIGEEALLLRQEIRSLGYDSEIYVERFNRGLRGKALPIEELSFDSHTALLYHFAVGSDLTYRFVSWRGRKILRFHNITPPHFFMKFRDFFSAQSCYLGWQQLDMLAYEHPLMFTPSLFNVSTFQSAKLFDKSRGPSPTVIPVFRRYGIFEEKMDQKTDLIQDALSQDARAAFLFVGRLSPNKCQHELISLIDQYKRFVDSKAFLCLIGSAYSREYQKTLVQFASALGLKVGFSFRDIKQSDVVFLGSVPESELRQYYRACRVFLCASEHEGFCVPLVEAMVGGLPILAHDSGAVPETISDPESVFNKSDYEGTLQMMFNLATDPHLRAKKIEQGKQRSLKFSLTEIRQPFRELIHSLS
ncbi:MAG: glycosyltransferase [Oligoflexales bacterium]|nr:glycosyltransferase [Oligoflexales bacterium]